MSWQELNEKVTEGIINAFRRNHEDLFETFKSQQHKCQESGHSFFVTPDGKFKMWTQNTGYSIEIKCCPFCEWKP
jgi:hypothetical protein